MGNNKMKEYSMEINLTETNLKALLAKESFTWCFSAVQNDDGTGMNRDEILINVKLTSENDKGGQ
jgi:hypothetical protein